MENQKLHVVKLNQKEYVLLKRVLLSGKDVGRKSVVWQAVPYPDDGDSEIIAGTISEPPENSLHYLRTAQPPAPSPLLTRLQEGGPLLAIKVAKTAEEEEDLRKEAQILRQFASPDWQEPGKAQVVQLVEPGLPSPGLPLLIETWVTGTQLDALDQTFDEPAALTIALQLAEILNTIYQMYSLVLTDTIKPNSLFWNEAQGSLILIDWNVMGMAADFRDKTLPIFGDTLFTLLCGKPILDSIYFNISPQALEKSERWGQLAYGTMALLRRVFLREFSGSTSDIALALYQAVKEQSDLWLKSEAELLQEARGLQGEAAASRYSVLKSKRGYLPPQEHDALLNYIRGIVADFGKRREDQSARLTLAWARAYAPQARDLRWAWLAHTAADEDKSATHEIGRLGMQALQALNAGDYPSALDALRGQSSNYLRALRAELKVWQGIQQGNDFAQAWDELQGIWGNWERQTDIKDIEKVIGASKTALQSLRTTPLVFDTVLEAFKDFCVLSPGIEALPQWIEALEHWQAGELESALAALYAGGPNFAHAHAQEIRKLLAQQLVSDARQAAAQDCWVRAVRLLEALLKYVPDASKIQSELAKYRENRAHYHELQKQSKDSYVPGQEEAQLRAYDAWMGAGFRYDSDGETAGEPLAKVRFTRALDWAARVAQQGEYDEACRIIETWGQDRLGQVLPNEALDLQTRESLESKAKEAITTYIRSHLNHDLRYIDMRAEQGAYIEAQLMAKRAQDDLREESRLDSATRLRLMDKVEDKIKTLTEGQRSSVDEKLAEARAYLPRLDGWHNKAAVDTWLIEVTMLVEQALQFDLNNREAQQAKLSLQAFREGRVKLQLVKALGDISYAVDALAEAHRYVPPGWEAFQDKVKHYLDTAKVFFIPAPPTTGSELKALAIQWRNYARAGVSSEGQSGIAEAWWKDIYQTLNQARDREAQASQTLFFERLERAFGRWSELSTHEERLRVYYEWQDALQEAAGLPDVVQKREKIEAQCKPDLAQSFAMLASDYVQRGYPEARARQAFTKACELDAASALAFAFQNATALLKDNRYAHAEKIAALAQTGVSGDNDARELLCEALKNDLRILWIRHLDCEDWQAIAGVYRALDGARARLLETYLYKDSPTISSKDKKNLALEYDQFMCGDLEVHKLAAALIQYRPEDCRDVVLSPERLIPLVKQKKYAPVLAMLGQRASNQGLSDAVQAEIHERCLKLYKDTPDKLAEKWRYLSEQIGRQRGLGLDLKKLAGHCQKGQTLTPTELEDSTRQLLEPDNAEVFAKTLAAVPVRQWPTLYRALEDTNRKNRLRRWGTAAIITLVVLAVIAAGVLLLLPMLTNTPSPSSTPGADGTVALEQPSDSGTPTASPTPQLLPTIEPAVGEGEWVYAGTALSYTLTLTNVGAVAVAPELQLPGTNLENVALRLEGEWSALSDRPTLPELPPGETLSVALLAYHHVLSEPDLVTYDLKVDIGAGVSPVKFPLVPPEELVSSSVSLQVPDTLTMPLSGGTVPVTLTSAVPGPYRIGVAPADKAFNCTMAQGGNEVGADGYYQVTLPESVMNEISSTEVMTTESATPTLWMAYVCPELAPGHPDASTGLSIGAITQTTFKVVAARYGIDIVAVDNPDTCQGEGCNGQSDTVLVIKNTGNLPVTPTLAYYSIKNTLAVTVTEMALSRIMTPALAIQPVYSDTTNQELVLTMVFTPTENSGLSTSTSITLAAPLHNMSELPLLSPNQVMTITLLVDNNFSNDRIDFRPEMVLVFVPKYTPVENKSVDLLCEEDLDGILGNYCVPTAWEQGHRAQPLPVIWVGPLK